MRQSGVLAPSGTAVTPANAAAAGAAISAACVVPNNGAQCATETLLPRIGDYLVLGADLKFLDDALLFRIFTIWDLSGVTMTQWVCNQVAGDHLSCLKGHPGSTHYGLFTSEGFSASIYPELTYNFGNGLELGAGALLLLGNDYTKFGDPAAGGTEVFTRGRV